MGNPIVSSQHVVVIGGGLVGSACAHYLAADGHRVTIVDRQTFGCGASHGNCGYVALGHVLPLTEPGAVLKTLKAMGRRNSPFYVKPRFDPALWTWLLRFAARCNEKDMMATAKVRAALLHSTGELYDELMQTLGDACEFERTGNLFVYHDRKAWEAYAKTNQILTEHFDEPARPLEGDAVCEFEPSLREGLGGGWYYETDSQLRPSKLLATWRAELERRGASIRENCGVESIVRRGDRAVAVKTVDGEIEADTVVVAAGAESPQFQKQLGCRIPIQPGKGYSITMSRPKICPKTSMIFQQHKVAVSPFKSGYRLGSTMEFSGYDDSVSARRLAILTDGASKYMREPIAEPIEESWAGWRPMTYDDLPIIDRSPAMENVFIASGHGMLGLTLSPVTGKLIAELIGKRTPHLDIAPLSVKRFG